MANVLERTCQVRNRVRQSRTLGSAGGGAQQCPRLPGRLPGASNRCWCMRLQTPIGHGNCSSNGSNVASLGHDSMQFNLLSDHGWAQGHFVTPSLVMSLVERIGRASVLDSRKPTDKQIAELWVAVLFTPGLSDDPAYYVRPVREDLPDVEVLVVDRADGRLSAIRVEVAQCTRYSSSVFEVIGKKLLNAITTGPSLWCSSKTAKNSFFAGANVRRLNTTFDSNFSRTTERVPSVLFHPFWIPLDTGNVATRGRSDGKNRRHERQ